MHNTTNRPGLRVWVVAVVLLVLAGGTGAWVYLESVNRLMAGVAAAPPQWRADTRVLDLLGGRSLHLEPTPGFVLHRQDNVTLLHDSAQQVGASRLELCGQRTRNAAAPDRLYPVLVGLGVAALHSGVPGETRKAALRAPLLIGPEQGQGMPGFVIVGQAHDMTEQPQALLQLRFDASQQPSGWAVLGDTQGFEAAPARTHFKNSLWLFWGASSAGAYTHALRIERKPTPSAQMSCQRADGAEPDDPGVLHFSLLRHAAASSHDQRRVLLDGVRHGAGLLQFRLPAGQHSFPASPEKLEDQRLFDRALALGLIRALPDGRLAVAPVDLHRAQLAGQPTPGWPSVVTNDEARMLLQRLHYKADGRYVRNRVEHHNHTRLWAALRMRSDNREARQALAAVQLAGMQATVQGFSVPLAEGLPDIAVRLFERIPEDWGPWLRVARWPGLRAEQAVTPAHEAELRIDLHAYPQLRGKQLQLLALHGVRVMDGGTVVFDQPACDGPACASAHIMQRLDVHVGQDADQLVLGLKAGHDFNRLAFEAANAEEVRVDSLGQPAWQARGPVRASPPAQARWPHIHAADGQLLHRDGVPTALAHELGLSRLLGLDPSHVESIAAVARDTAHHQVAVTIDPRYQALAREVLSCVAVAQGQWLAVDQRCKLPDAEPGTAPPVASLVLLDAAQGDIVAAVELPDPPQFSNVAEQLAFHRYHLAASPLAMWAWQHDGSSRHAPGSTAKLISALGLETLALEQRKLNAQLDGMTAGEGFSFSSPCYPNCGARTRIENFQRHPPARYLENGRFGLQQALVHSVNTWFAYMAEQHDAIVRLPFADPFGLPLSLAGGLQHARPLDDVARHFGFEHGWRLDDGLFGKQLPINSVLRSTPSFYDWVQDRHNLRQQAIGLRAAVTPLQMAHVAAGIAIGAVPPQPRLIRTGGQPQVGKALPMRLDRIRHAMQAVPQLGTARTAFQKNATRRSLLGVIHGKTGTAPLHDAQARNSAWFVGYLAPHSLPGEAATLAFAVRVSPTHGTGGAIAAEVMAAFFETLLLSTPQQAATPRTLSHPRQ